MTDDQMFTAISRRACPALADTLLAVAAAWRPVDWADADARLDQLARPLFAAPPGGRERAAALAELVTGTFEPDAGLVDGLWLDRVLERRRGHPVLIAAIATELGRRAGWEITVCSSPTAWYAGLHDGGVLWLVEALGTGNAADSPSMVRRHCAHEIAFVVLTGLADRFAGARDQEHARSLRDHLALFTAPEDAGRTLLGALWTDDG
jgi:hypothetical protein